MSTHPGLRRNVHLLEIVVLVVSTQPSLGKLVKKEKAKKKSVVVLVVNFCYFAPPSPPPPENKFRNFFISENKFLFSAKCDFLKNIY
jgi:hypothetical protein